MKEQKRKKMRYQIWIARASLIAGFCWGVFFTYTVFAEAIPDKIHIEKGQAEIFNFHVPVTGELQQEGVEVFGNQSPAVEEDKITLDLNESFSLKSQERGKYNMSCKLLGLFHIKDVSVEVMDKEQVVP